jgi:hypothetical protein
MKVKKSQIDALANLILKEISTQVREIIREEFDIEAKRLKKQIFEDLKARNVIVMKPNREVSKNAIQKQQVHIVRKAPHLVEKKKIDTGSDLINDILEDIPVEERTESVLNELDLSSGIDFSPTTSFQEATKQSINEAKRMNSGREVWKPAPGEAINFDPNTMDPTRIDWGDFVDEVDKRAKEHHL